jgi:hypothetical protein
MLGGLQAGQGRVSMLGGFTGRVGFLCQGGLQAGRGRVSMLGDLQAG